MIVETSVLVAVLKHEDGWETLMQQALDDPSVKRVSAANYLEAAAVTDRTNDPVRMEALDTLMESLDAHIAPVTAIQARIARDAYRRFGKGSGHPARLNFGDCFAYALSVDANEPLLFKGTDFSQTDVRHI